jgi:hypothetical protein
MKRIAVVLALVALLAGCNWEIDRPSPVYFEGEFQVTGTATHANIAYRIFDGVGFHEQFNVALPWTFTWAWTQTGDEFYLSAQSDDAAGDLTVTALVDGVPVATQTTTDPFGFVAVYGTVP